MRAAAVALALAVIPTKADAAWLVDYTGYTSVGQPTDKVDGIINFGVYQNNGVTGNWATDLGIASALLPSGAQTSANYVYFYSVVNSYRPSANLPDETLVSLYIDTQQRDTSFGIVQGSGLGAGFTDLQGLVGTTTTVTNTTSGAGVNNRLLGGGLNENGPSTGDPQPLDGVPTHVISEETPIPPIGILTGPLGTSSSTLLPQGGTAVSGYVNDPLYNVQARQATFLLGTNQFSTLVFVTSDYAPTFGGGTLKGASGYSGGDVPVPTPEPGTLALLAMAVPLFGWGYKRRLRLKPVASIA